MRTERLLLPHFFGRLAHHAAALNLSRAGLRFLPRDNNGDSALRLRECKLMPHTHIHPSELQFFYTDA